MIASTLDLLAFESSDLPGLIAFLLITVLSGLGGLLKKKKEKEEDKEGGKLPEILEEDAMIEQPATRTGGQPLALPRTKSTPMPPIVDPTQPAQLPIARRARRARSVSSPEEQVGRERVTPAEHSAQLGNLAHKQATRQTREVARTTPSDHLRRLTPSDIRRAIILREIIGPPVGLRDPLEDFQ